MAALTAILKTIQQHESIAAAARYNVSPYSLTPQQNFAYPSSHASGAYQFQPGTWQSYTQQSGIGTQYREAYQAPPAVQDAVAAWVVTNKGTGDWAPYSGALPGLTSVDVTPQQLIDQGGLYNQSAPIGGNPLAMGDFGTQPISGFTPDFSTTPPAAQPSTPSNPFVGESENTIPQGPQVITTDPNSNVVLSDLCIAGECVPGDISQGTVVTPGNVQGPSLSTVPPVNMSDFGTQPISGFTPNLTASSGTSAPETPSIPIFDSTGNQIGAEASIPPDFSGIQNFGAVDVTAGSAFGGSFDASGSPIGSSGGFGGLGIPGLGGSSSGGLGYETQPGNISTQNEAVTGTPTPVPDVANAISNVGKGLNTTVGAAGTTISKGISGALSNAITSTENYAGNFLQRGGVMVLAVILALIGGFLLMRSGGGKLIPGT